MKKTVIAAMVLALALVVSGCSDDSAALKQQIADLQQQVADLQGGAQNDAQNDTQNDAQNDTQSDTQSNTQNNTQSGVTETQLEGLVADFEQKAAAAVSGTDKSLEKYFELKQQAESVDRQIDARENAMEADYRAGTLTREQYRTSELALDALENRVDAAEDRLELAFGIDD